MEELVAVRIKDGIFVGNAGAAADKTLLIMNKITHIINCAGAEVGDYFLGDPGFSYLSFPWKDAAGSVCTTILFDAADENINRAVQFIDEALAVGECVLVHSVYGNSRSPALIAAYMIVKYGWKLESALLYMRMAHPDADIKPHFQRQLRQFAKRHDVNHDIFSPDVDDSHFDLDNDQWMLRNTLLNGLLYKEQISNTLYRQCIEKVDVGHPINGKSMKARITFVDTKKGTDTDSQSTCPVVNNATSFSADFASADTQGFVGSRGHSSLRTGRRSPSILSRSTSPCVRKSESDPRTCPKGRQALPVVHNGTTETSTSAPPKSVERSSGLRTAASASRTHSYSSQLGDKSAKGWGGEDAPALSPQQKLSLASCRTIDYARLAPPAQLRSPFAALGSSHKYRNGSPLPAPTDKKATLKSSHTRIVSSPSSRPLNTTSVGSTSIPGSAWGGTSLTVSSPTALRNTSRTSSPLSTNKPTRDVVGRPSVASYRGIAPSRSSVGPRTATETTYRVSWSSSHSPSRQSVDHATGSRTGSRRRGLSPVYSTPKRSSSAGKNAPGTPDKSSSRTNSPKAQRYRDPGSGFLNSSFTSSESNGTSGTGNGAATKNTSTVRRQPPPVISSRRIA